MRPSSCRRYKNTSHRCTRSPKDSGHFSSPRQTISKTRPVQIERDFIRTADPPRSPAAPSGCIGSVFRRMGKIHHSEIPYDHGLRPPRNFADIPADPPDQSSHLFPEAATPYARCTRSPRLHSASRPCLRCYYALIRFASMLLITAAFVWVPPTEKNLRLRASGRLLYFSGGTFWQYRSMPYPGRLSRFVSRQLLKYLLAGAPLYNRLQMKAS